jgi:hypothetical protein
MWSAVAFRRGVSDALSEVERLKVANGDRDTALPHHQCHVTTTTEVTQSLETAL